ncbi:MAG TPA: hypothetical protein VKU90_01565 [Caulobacteraceae bacterium]|nr:hypothetical protein [Caulobacteraceae bacterium]
MSTLPNMDLNDSPTDDFLVAIADVRARLRPPSQRPAPVWPAVAAAALFAVSAMIFATAAILSPPAHLTPIADDVRGPA